MIRIILFLLLIALASGGRGLGCRPDRRRRAVVGRLARPDHAAGVRAGARHHRRRGDDAVGDPARRCGARRTVCGAAAASGVRPAAGMRSRKGCSRSATAIPPPRASMPRRRATSCRARSAGAAAARAIGAARWRPRRRAARLPRHGRARGYAAAGPARSVHRGAARRRSGRRRHGRRGGAETGAVVDLGLARRARLPLRQGRLGRRADDPRQQSLLRADRQGDLSPPARRAADRARAGAGEGRSRPVARKARWRRSSWRRRWCRPRCSRANSKARRIRCGARCASSRRRGWRSRIPISPTPMRM